MKMDLFCALLLSCWFFTGCASTNELGRQQLPFNTQALELNPSSPVSGELYFDSAGKMGGVASTAILRVICPTQNSGGTGFVYKNVVITAAHVVVDCPKDAVLLTSTGKTIQVESVKIDSIRDLALIVPKELPQLPSFEISDRDQFPVGVMVTTWGFPEGYTGYIPLLSVGHLAGVQSFNQNGVPINKWVVNAAFNRGNSGGPVINLEDGKVMGVVSAKLAPIPDNIQKEIAVMATTEVDANFLGVYYTLHTADQKTQKVTEGRLVSEVLDYIRSQTQLVIAYAVQSSQLREFLKENGVKLD